MAVVTTNATGLEEALQSLGLDGPLHHYPSSNMLEKPLDVARSYLADILHSLADVELSVAYNSIQWPNNIFNGDLVVILPRLSHGADTDALALDLIQRVRPIAHPT